MNGNDVLFSERNPHCPLLETGYSSPPIRNQTKALPITGIELHSEIWYLSTPIKRRT